MKLIVFGSTGGIGRQVVAQALDAGHQVTAVARRPEMITIQNERLRVVRGDALELASFQQALTGQELVVSALGILTKEPTVFYSSSMNNIMEAMRASGARRLLCVSAGATDPGGWQRWIIKPILWRLYGGMYADLLRMENVVKASDLDWTIVRPPRLLDKPRTGRYQVAINKHLVFGNSIPRADVADFIITHLVDPDTFHTTVELAK
ncbi:MAG: NAD(P)-binding oxidoreductase [Anaerolineales bacterium]|jgi:putative NADH-flavin reductase